MEDLIREESELKLQNKTKFNLIVNNTSSSKVSKSEMKRIQDRIESIEAKYGYKTKVVESGYFNFDFYFRHNINFMSADEEIQKKKDRVFKAGLTVNKSSKIKTGREVLGKVVDALIDKGV